MTLDMFVSRVNKASISTFFDIVKVSLKHTKSSLLESNVFGEGFDVLIFEAKFM